MIEKVLTMLSPEHDDNAHKTALVVRVLCGLKSAYAEFRSHLASYMYNMGYTSCHANPNL